MPKKVKPIEYRFRYNNEWQMVSVLPNFQGSFADFLSFKNIHYLPEDTQFIRIKRDTETIEIRAYPCAVIRVTIYNF